METALVAGGLRVLPQGAVAPPSVFVAPGTSWLTPSQLSFGRFNANWVILGIVSAANEASIVDIDALAQSIVTACNSLPQGWGLPVVGPPGIVTLGGVPYLGFRAEIQGVL